MSKELTINGARPSATFSYRAGPGAGTNPGGGGSGGSDTGTGGNVLDGPPTPPAEPTPLIDATWLLLLLAVAYWLVRRLSVTESK